MLEGLAELGRPVVVFSGGEPLLRPDWQELTQHARSLGLPIALATNGTLIDSDLAGRIATAGFSRVAVSLDAPDAARHDAFRGQAGAFDAALRGIEHLRVAGLPVQINSTLTAGNADELDAFYDLALRLGAAAWHLFVLVPVGCGLELGQSEQLSAQQCEEVLGWVCRRQAQGPLDIKVTCAPHYARVARQFLERHGSGGPNEPGAQRVASMLRGRGCLAGTGVVFVSSIGEVFPCGYFPVSCGNIRRHTLGEIWRTSPVLARLRDASGLTGRCGACEYRQTCGGCRARALAATGDYMGPEPACPHVPGE